MENKKVNGLSYTSLGLGIGALMPVFCILLFIPAMIVSLIAIIKQRNWASILGFIFSAIAFIVEVVAINNLANVINNI